MNEILELLQTVALLCQISVAHSNGGILRETAVNSAALQRNCQIEYLKCVDAKDKGRGAALKECVQRR